jgi:hypothetical protein
MKSRHVTTALAVAATLTLGGAGAAGAEGAAEAPTTTAPTARPAHRFTCEDARTRVTRLDARIEGATNRIARAEARRDRLRDEHRTELAEAVTRRIDLGREHLARLKARLDRVKAALAERCPTPGS